MSTPENKTESRKKRSLPEAAKPFRFKPGQSGNPGGRPKKKPVTDAYLKMGHARVPREVLQKLGMSKRYGMTYLELAAMGMLRKMAEGVADTAKEITDRIEGKVVTEISGPGGAPIALDLDVEENVTVYEQLRTVATRVRDRLAKRVDPKSR